MKKIYLVLINYKNHKVTIECLDSLLKIKRSNFELHTILVDNYPPDRIEIDENKYKEIKLKVIMNPKNLGFAGGMNTGIKIATENDAEYVLIHNNDTYVKDDFLEKLFEFAEKNKEAGIIAPKIYFAEGFEFHKDKYKESEKGKVIWYAGGRIDWKNVIGEHIGVDEVDEGQFSKTTETELASGCCMLVRAEVFEKTGIFDEKYFLYYEDADLCVRAKKAGYKIYFVPESIIWHKNAGSAGGSGSDLQDYYITRNRILFAVKYASPRAKIAVLREGLRLMSKGRTMQKKGAGDFFRNKFGKGTI